MPSSPGIGPTPQRRIHGAVRRRIILAINAWCDFARTGYPFWFFRNEDASIVSKCTGSECHRDCTYRDGNCFGIARAMVTSAFVHGEGDIANTYQQIVSYDTCKSFGLRPTRPRFQMDQL